VTDDGYPLEPVITIPQGVRDVTVSKTGQVQVLIGEQPQPQDVGQIELATFINEGGLEQIGDNLLLETTASGPANISSPGKRASA
jgi:flagellar basal-body rod protein FlgG